MRGPEFFDRCIRDIATCKKVLDAGGATPFQKHMAKYKDLYQDVEYKTLDISPHYKPDIVGDIQNIPLKKSSVDGVICIAVLEHIPNPYKAVAEIHRVLKSGGKAFFSFPSVYPYHAKPDPGGYPDNWRFMPGGIELLFKEFSQLEYVKASCFFETLSQFFPLRKFTGPIARFLDWLFRTHKRSVAQSYHVFVVK